jgi:hypothetical protein
LNFVHLYPVGGFSPDIAGFGKGCMSGLKRRPTTSLTIKDFSEPYQ